MKLTPELKAKLESEGYRELREVESRGVCGILRFAYTWGLVYGLNDIGYEGRWCYDNHIEPSLELACWDGVEDPKGFWIKYKGKGGERKNPNRINY